MSFSRIVGLFMPGDNSILLSVSAGLQAPMLMKTACGLDSGGVSVTILRLGQGTGKTRIERWSGSLTRSRLQKREMRAIRRESAV